MTHSMTHSPRHPDTHSSTHTVIHSMTHSSTHPVIHSLTPFPYRHVARISWDFSFLLLMEVPLD